MNQSVKQRSSKNGILSETKVRQVKALGVIAFWCVMIWIGVKAGV